MRNKELTKLIAIIGKPLAHSLSPLIHNAAFNKIGMNYNYIPLEINEELVEGVVSLGKNSNITGLNITMPYKKTIIPFLDDLDETAKVAGAVNVVNFENGISKGYNTDVEAINSAIQKKINSTLSGKKVCIFGAGGVANASAVAMANEKVSEIRITNRTEERAKMLIKNLKVKFTDINFTFVEKKYIKEVITVTDILINATPVGMIPEDDKMPFSVDNINSNHIVVDLIYRPMMTKLLNESAKRGAQIVSGADIFLRQALASFEIWFKRKAPADVMEDTLVKYLTSKR